jgi:hypothetical protein
MSVGVPVVEGVGVGNGVAVGDNSGEMIIVGVKGGDNVADGVGILALVGGNEVKLTTAVSVWAGAKVGVKLTSGAATQPVKIKMRNRTPQRRSKILNIILSLGMR